MRRQIEFAAGKANFAATLSVNENSRKRIHVIRGESNAASIPLLRYRDGSLIPCCANAAQTFIFPSRMRIDSLGILLHVVRDAGPAAGHFEMAPARLREFFVGSARGLPAPKAIDADFFAR